MSDGAHPMKKVQRQRGERRAACLFIAYLSIGRNAVLQAIEFPAGISDLDTTLTNVQALRKGNKMIQIDTYLQVM